MARTAKQKAATRKLIKFNKAKANKKKKAKVKPRSAPKRKTAKRKAPRKVNKRKSPKRSMAKGSKIPFINNPTVKKVAVGVGLATLATVALTAVAPQFANNPIVKPAVAFLGGGPVAAVVTLFLNGGLGSLGLGGNQSNGGGVNAGFA